VLIFFTADADKECRRSARHIGKAESESEESEAADSVGVKEQAQKMSEGVKGSNYPPGPTEWLVPPILLVSVEEHSDGRVRRSP
jgi:hypothetical protein